MERATARQQVVDGKTGQQPDIVTAQLQRASCKDRVVEYAEIVYNRSRGQVGLPYVAGNAVVVHHLTRQPRLAGIDNVLSIPPVAHDGGVARNRGHLPHSALARNRRH